LYNCLAEKRKNPAQMNTSRFKEGKLPRSRRSQNAEAQKTNEDPMSETQRVRHREETMRQPQTVNATNFI